MPVLIKITFCRDGQSIWLEGHFAKRPRLTDGDTDLFAGTEFIAPDVLFKTTNAGSTEKIQRSSRHVPQRRVSGGPAF